MIGSGMQNLECCLFDYILQAISKKKKKYINYTYLYVYHLTLNYTVYEFAFNCIEILAMGAIKVTPNYRAIVWRPRHKDNRGDPYHGGCHGGLVTEKIIVIPKLQRYKCTAKKQ